MSLDSIQIPDGIAPQVVDFRQERFSFAILNSSSKPREVMFIGNMMTIPPKHQFVPGRSDVDADGDPIPGSYVIEDRYEYSEELNDEFCVFDARKAAAHILGIQRSSDGKTSQASSPYALGGMSLLPRHAPKSVWQPVAAAGEQRSFAARVDDAREIVRVEDERNAKRKAAGLDAAPPVRRKDADAYREALMVLKQYDQIMSSQTRTVDDLSPHEAETLDQEVELMAFVRARAYELVEKASKDKTINREALFAELMDDAEFRAKIAKSWKIRRRGHMEQKSEDLEAAADAGLKVSEAGLEK